MKILKNREIRRIGRFLENRGSGPPIRGPPGSGPPGSGPPGSGPPEGDPPGSGPPGSGPPGSGPTPSRGGFQKSNLPPYIELTKAWSDTSSLKVCNFLEKKKCKKCQVLRFSLRRFHTEKPLFHTFSRFSGPRNRPISVRRGPIWPESARIGRNRPKSAEIGRFGPIWAQIGQKVHFLGSGYKKRRDFGSDPL